MGKKSEHLGIADYRIGVIADTHGLVRAEVAGVFNGVDHIVHAGDIGGRDVIAGLEEIAPVTAVNGNNDDDTGEEIARFELAGLRILLTHILPRPRQPDGRVMESLRRKPADLVVFGHSHLPHDERVDRVWYFNPASAGPRRFDLPVSVGIFEKTGTDWRGYHVALDERSVGALKTRMNQLSRRS
jgi:putative phosphoesterase